MANVADYRSKIPSGPGTVESAKKAFFDTAAVMNMMDRKTRKVLSRFGAYVRQRGQSSLKKAPQADVKTGLVVRGRRKKGAKTHDARAKPGKPPYGHANQKLKRLTFFAYDAENKSVAIGPAKIQEVRGGGPDLLEYGGDTVLITKKGKQRRAHYRGNPWMVPAFEAELPAVAGWYAEEA